MAKAGIAYVGSADGLRVFSDPGGLGHWREVLHTLHGQQVRAILAVDALTLTVALSPGDAQRSDDGGNTWSVAQPDEAAMINDLLTFKLVIATAQGPAQWRGSQPPAPGAHTLALLSGKQETFVAAIADGSAIVRSDDGGANWDVVELDDPLQGTINVFAPASYHMDVVWAGTDAGQLLRSDNRGRSWMEVARIGTPILSLAVVRLI